MAVPETWIHPAYQQWSWTANTWQRYSTQNQLWYHLRCRWQVQRPNAHVGWNLQEARTIKLVCTDRNRTGGHNTSAISKRSWTVNQSQLPTGERLQKMFTISPCSSLSSSIDNISLTINWELMSTKLLVQFILALVSNEVSAKIINMTRITMCP